MLDGGTRTQLASVCQWSVSWREKWTDAMLVLYAMATECHWRDIVESVIHIRRHRQPGTRAKGPARQDQTTWHHDT
jgi:hypothetical protein